MYQHRIVDCLLTRPSLAIQPLMHALFSCTPHILELQGLPHTDFQNPRCRPKHWHTSNVARSAMASAKSLVQHAVRESRRGGLGAPEYTLVQKRIQETRPA